MTQIDIHQFAYTHHVKFGTSGIRGKNTDLTDLVCYVYAFAFIQYLEANQQLKPDDCFMIAGDLRTNTDHIIQIIMEAIKHKGYRFEYCGKIPTPALSYYCLEQSSPGLMVTGSHIPADMNGIKFYTGSGEILKQDETAILSQSITIDMNLFTTDGSLKHDLGEMLHASSHAYNLFIKRYQHFFSSTALAKLRIGVYEHSSVSSKLLTDILKRLGADVVSFGIEQDFYGLDTEALTEKDIHVAKDALNKYQLDAVVSTDGDGDRPLISDEHGEWIHGDIIGMLCAIILKANDVVIPVSCNSSIDQLAQFKEILRTKIGSPYIVETMQQLTHAGEKKVLGYEANGGILLGSEFSEADKILKPLPTRDSIIAILCILAYANQHHIKISELVKQYSHAYTISSSIKHIPTEQSKQLIQALDNEEKIQKFFLIKTPVKKIDQTDGLRIYFADDTIIHLRPSGNAPELRCYTEAQTKMAALELNHHCMKQINHWLQQFTAVLQ